MFACVVLTLSVFAFLTRSLTLHSPRETLSTPADATLTGWTPRPTSPVLGQLVRQRLEKRDYSTSCAYFTVSSSTYSLHCSLPEYCIFNNARSAMGCCTLDPEGSATCILPTACVDYSYSTEYCNPSTGCGVGTLACGVGTNTECGVFVADYNLQGYTGFLCLESALTLDAFLYTANTTVTTSATIITSTTPINSLTTPTTTSSTTTSIITSTTTSVPVTTMPPTPTPTPTPTPSNNHIAAIAGGTVGGVAGVAIVIAAIWFVISRVNTKRKEGEGDIPEMTGTMAKDS